MTRKYLTRLARRLMGEYEPIPPGRVGGIRVTSDKVEGQLPVVNFREMLHTGLPQLDLDCAGYVKQSLIGDDDGTWMTNMPCELVQMWREFAGRARGRILIAGLGLGIATKMVAKKPTVKSVTVVEINPDVVELVGPHVGSKVEVVCADIRDFIKGPLPYDACFLDTWQSDGEWTWQSQVVPMKRAIGPRIPRVVGWHENVMRAQVWGFPGAGLFRAADVPEEAMKKSINCHWYAFRKAAIAAGFRNGARIDPSSDFMEMIAIAEANGRDPDLQSLARVMLHYVGTDLWEDTFGKHWDEAWDEGR